MRLVITALTALSVFFTSCDNRRKPAPLFNGAAASNKTYDSLLRSLSKHYVLQLAKTSAAYKNDILRFYGKTGEQALADSIEYHRALMQFYSLDSSILNYLVSFRGSRAICHWVGSENPISSTIPRYLINLTEERGAAVLIYDYLNYTPATLPAIVPANIDEVIERYNLPLLESWIKENMASPKVMREKFKSDTDYFRPPAYRIKRQAQ